MWLNVIYVFYQTESSIQWFRLAFSKGLNRMGDYLPLLEDGNRLIFPNVIKIPADEQSP
jgi:hypothetical protein